MPYSIIVWLVNASHETQQDEERLHTATINRSESPGAASGVNVPPVFNRLVYGLYEDQEDADAALSSIATSLQQNAPLQITVRGDQKFLVPASRVHYVVCAEVVRPKDQTQE